MIIWINGAFGAGKTTCAYELDRRLENSFVYDPENIGGFIRKNIPKKLHKSDFQNHKQWRLFNYEMLKYLADEYNGIILVPMTLVNRKYYDEIIGKLINEGIKLNHFILYADKKTIEKRLKKRFEMNNSWAKLQIDRCIDAFNDEIIEEKIITDNKTIDEIVEEIARKNGLTLTYDRRTSVKKWIDRVIILLKHIRR